MRILVAPDSFKESLSAVEVAEIIRGGIERVIPDASCELLPMADGGEGTVEAIVAASAGEIIQCEVSGPLGHKRLAKYGLIHAGSTAVIEMAEASGLTLIDAASRDPLQTSSYGCGELLHDALARGVTQIVMGIGGSATNDGGLGMCQALGAIFTGEAERELPAPLTGGDLLNIRDVDFSNLDQRLASVAITSACDVDNPLLGPEGATEVFGRQKGANEQAVLTLEDGLTNAYDIIENTIGREVKHLAGAGAAGGMGAALIGIFDATLRPGIELVAELVQLDARIQNADLVITGEGSLDGQTAYGKAPAGVAKIAKRHNVPVIAIGGMLGNNAAALFNHDITALESTVTRPCSSDDAITGAVDNLTAAAMRVGHWINFARSFRL